MKVRRKDGTLQEGSPKQAAEWLLEDRAAMLNCGTCFGYGLWAWGDAVPIGPMDAREGYSTIACPECGANRNPEQEQPR